MLKRLGGDELVVDETLTMMSEKEGKLKDKEAVHVAHFDSPWR